MPDGPIKSEWHKSVKKELKTLVEAHTFILEDLFDGETSVPVMETFKVKIKSDGSLDKHKTRFVVQGDLQGKPIAEDKWSPTASFCSMKKFLVMLAGLRQESSSWTSLEPSFRPKPEVGCL